jgi:hypothetical protein
MMMMVHASAQKAKKKEHEREKVEGDMYESSIGMCGHRSFHDE